jgi:hypothetical protein
MAVERQDGEEAHEVQYVEWFFAMRKQLFLLLVTYV